jgi:diguanylate cyclase (GGDEF)-like protein
MVVDRRKKAAVRGIAELPVLPAVVMRVTKIASNPESSVSDLASIIEQDPGLSARVLHAVNSAYYSPRCKIATAQRAVGFMGIHAVRNLVLCLAARRLFVIKADFPLELFWENALRRAAAARCIAQRVNLSQPDEVFTLGLCQDLAVLIRLQENPENGPAFARVARQAAEQRLEVEEETGERHDELGFRTFTEWGLPEALTVPLLYHHRPAEAPAHVDRAKVAHAAEAVADLLMVEDKQHAMTTARARIEMLGLPADDLGDVVEETTRLVADAAQMLEVSVSKQPSFEAIQAAASEGLLSLNLSYQSLTDQLKDSLEQQRQMAEELKRLNEKLEKQATTDALTGLANRRSFDETLARELAQADRQQKPLCLLMMDVDHFKRFNDTHGHQAGDLVLKSVGQAIGASVRKSDFAARYGGEEFAVILPFTPREGALIVAERIRARIEALRISWERQDLGVTISVGCAEGSDPGHARAAVKLLRNADDALYDAKEGGRNRVVAG